jgi:hypothetical protein
VTATLVGGYRALPESLTAITLLANSMNVLRSRTPARLYVYDTVLERLAQDLEHMTATLGPFIQEEDAVVGQRHVAGHRHGAPADQPDIRDGVMGGATQAGGDPRHTGAGEPRDAVNAGG